MKMGDDTVMTGVALFSETSICCGIVLDVLGLDIIDIFFYFFVYFPAIKHSKTSTIFVERR